MLFLRKKQTRSKKTCRFYTTGLIAITYMFRCVELAQTTSVLLRRTAVIGRSRIDRTMPTVVTFTVFVRRIVRISTTRLRRLRSTKSAGANISKIV